MKFIVLINDDVKVFARPPLDKSQILEVCPNFLAREKLLYWNEYCHIDHTILRRKENEEKLKYLFRNKINGNEILSIYPNLDNFGKSINVNDYDRVV